MTIEDVKSTIKNHILNSISHRDLCSLCNIFEIPTSGRRIQMQKRLLDSILMANNIEFLQRILLMINHSISRENNLNNVPNPQILSTSSNYIQNPLIPSNPELSRPITNYSHNGYSSLNSSAEMNPKLYCITNDMLDSCPINVRPEILPGIDVRAIFVPNYTKYPNGFFNAPSGCQTVINGRVGVPNVQLPYVAKNTVISSNQFYCCQVILHPLSLLVPKPTPNQVQTNRIIAKQQLQFTLSSHVRHLITTHRSQVNNRRFYKWQILIRFGMYDPSKPFPSSSLDTASSLPEYIPPYLTLFVNNASVPLWDILPSNSTAKEGKRHARPINISDYIKFSPADEQNGFRQSITVNWWQTPGIYQYYYIGVFLERKLLVTELLERFVNKTHHVQMPMEFTVNFIREKFSTNNNNNDINKNQFNKNNVIDNDNSLNGLINEEEEDDDMVISSVLPVSLLCPVGKSRIECPLRGLHCHHLQCFDAGLYLMMNERRSVWKCPVCDSSATINELFVDEFFLKILNEFADNEDITEVNVNPDATYVGVAVKESREHKQHLGNIISNGFNNNTVNEVKVEEDNTNVNNNVSDSGNTPIILLESEDDDTDDENDDKDIEKPLVKSDSQSVLSIPTNSSKNTENLTSQNTKSPNKSSNPPMTIDLTSDSDEDNERNTVNVSSQNVGNKPVNQPICITSTSNSSTSAPHFHPTNANNPTLIRHFGNQHPYIAPKLPPPNFIKLPDTNISRNISFFQASPSSVSSAASNTNAVLSNPFQNVINNPSSSNQPMNKVATPLLWVPQNQRFPSHNHRPNEIFNCCMPAMKPCFPPAQNSFSIMQPTTSYNPSLPVSSVPFPSNVIAKAIKIDPHINYGTPFDKEVNKNSSTTEPLFDTTNNSTSNQNAVPHDKKRKSDPKKPSTSGKPITRRSTRLLSQHRKVYREKSLSEDDLSGSDESDIIGVLRPKRRNNFDDSTSSNSSVSNRKRKRLLPEPSSSDEESNKNRILHDHRLDQSSSSSDKLTNFDKYPLVLLNKLDPVLLKVYLQQNEVSSKDDDESRCLSAVTCPSSSQQPALLVCELSEPNHGGEPHENVVLSDAKPVDIGI